MFRHTVEKFSKVLPLIVLASFMWLAIFGVGIGMTMDEKGAMSRCPFMAGEANFCPMGITEHIAKWQKTITVIPKLYTSIIFSLLVVLTIFSISKLFHQLKIILIKRNSQFERRKESESRASNPFLIAFSDGILNPKIYEAAVF